MSDNFTDFNNDTLPAAAVTHLNFPALIFGIFLIIVVTCGNVLVCISVYLEKALKTTTNYFIVSLAFADLLLAVLVLPLFVYAEFQGGVWSLNMLMCDGLMTMDVMLCTASIFNLCAISVDRFIAVSIPLNYNRKHVDHRQIILLSATWLLALAVASPVIFGINNVPNRDPTECKLEDNNYVVYSSVCSFFIPCPIMVLLYFGVFRGLRRWEETRKAKLRSSIEACRKLQHAAITTTLAPVPGTIPGPLPMPLPRIIERDLAQSRMDDSGDYIQQEIPYPRQYRENSVPTLTFSQQQMKTRAKLNSRERKAMKVLPVVVGCFLFCWTPFFVVHTMRAVCLTCSIHPGLMSTVTWLGYVNSALNPIIYTMFNTEFKKFFKKCFRSCC
ncbi:dopamine receptor D4b [Pundamilia nyererei]|uniref:D(4) dopamine receptor-like n=1 Tax=Pundamilia nyererei TaxID=303518 RepID=A0A3B4EYR4_9CICH|nr:PREDICTED: D(4) dopamine receptor-like [Pundamilia nyererei]XP_014187046.1 D(4) dopamine receptor [Haplochromis burtoni]XP_026002892.1 D(4) dopamine receptor-like isoform X1 [Astatotilapia calliptera]XP_039897180.1 dopamine receptor D4b isoform X1 [Simochromis diagramma]